MELEEEKSTTTNSSSTSFSANLNKCKFYIWDEIVIHNTEDDFWVVIHDRIFDLTRFIGERRKSCWNVNMEYLLAFGGKNLSNFFNFEGFPRTEISLNTKRPRVLFPPILERETHELFSNTGKLWSQNPLYYAGHVTKQERRLRIINTLTGRTRRMKVCEEDTLNTIKEKYTKLYNSHAGGYIWRKDYKNGTVSGNLDPNLTLTENGLFLQRDGIEPPPAIWLFFADGFTIG